MQGIGLNVSVEIDNIPISFEVAYDSATLSMEVECCKLDLAKTANERFNDLNVVLPEGSSPLMIAKFSGSVAKTDRNKTPDPDGAYRLFRFDGEMENIEIPIPIVSDIRIDKAFFSYQYHSAKSSGTGSNFKDQIVFLGCKLSVKEGSKLDQYLTGATLTGAYFLSNNATIIYFDFSGKINMGKIIDALFGFPAANLEIDVQSAGLFRIAKTDKTKSLPNGKGNPPSTVPEMTYKEALVQMAHLQNATPGPTGNPSVKDLMPASFPLGEETTTVNGVTTSKFGIKHNSKIDTDFMDQFEKAFAGDNVTGICFWAMVDFNNSPLFGTLNTIGYDPQKVSSLVLYGFNTHTTGTQPKKTSTYFFAQLPSITLFDFLTLGGTHGRDGILFKYSSEKKEYELSGSIAFHALDRDFLFEGDLLVNEVHLVAELAVTLSSQESINAPMGMTGICFGELFFCMEKTFAETKPGVKPKPSLAIGGLVLIRIGSTDLKLSGNIVFESNETRLVLVAIEASHALLLSDFVSEVLHLEWAWLDFITRQIGFISGSMYYLSPPENKKDDGKYTFFYENPIKEKTPVSADKKSAKYKRTDTYMPGYHIHADLLLFEQYVFAIDLSVEKKGIVLSGAFAGTYQKKGENDYTITENTNITAFFISFKSPSLNINTIEKRIFLEIGNILIFKSEFGKITIEYFNGIFGGSFQRDKMGFGFAWQWTTKKGSSGGFSITKIDDIDGRDLDCIDKFKKILNGFNTKGGCAAITDSMLKGFKSKFTPALQEGKSPTENEDGTMRIPLALYYTLSMGKTELTKDVILLSLDVSIPTTASDLPEKIFITITNNLDNILEDLLSSGAVYKAIAIAIAKKVGGSLISKILCKLSSKKAGIELAEALEALLEAGMVLGDVGILLELEGLLYALGFVGVAVAAIAFAALIYKIWDSANNRFNSEEDRKKAQEKLDSFKADILKKIQSMSARMEKVAASIQLERLEVGIDPDGQYKLDWYFPDNKDLGENETLSYQLVFLSGPIGQPSPSKSPIPAIGFELMKETTNHFSWTNMRQQDPNFQLNASIQTSVTGSVYMNELAIENLQNYIQSLQQAVLVLDAVGDQLEGAVEFNNQLKKFNHDMQEFISHGIRSKVVYATTNNQFMIGQSALGINTKI